MKLLKGLRKVHIIFIVGIILFSFFIVHIAAAVTAEPGSDDDPIVSQSYVDAKVGELNDKINELTGNIDVLTAKIDELRTVIDELSEQNELLKQQLEQQSASSKFVPVQVKAGQQLIAGESTEFIIRVGKATGISGKNGDGLSDVTTDTTNDPQKDIKKNIVTGQEIPLNHLIFVARDDGRGFKAVTDVWVIVKGKYQIK